MTNAYSDKELTSYDLADIARWLADKIIKAKPEDKNLESLIRDELSHWKNARGK